MSVETVAAKIVSAEKMKQRFETVKPLGRETGGPPVPLTPQHGAVVMVGLDRIHVTGWNPRTHFDPVTLQELADSIKEKGVLQNLVLRPKPGGDARNPQFDLVAGERRYRAAKMAKLDVVPAAVRELSDREVVELMVVENGQRDDVHPLEEANGYATLRDQFKVPLPEIAKKVSMSLRHVQTRLQLLQLSPPVRQAFSEGKIDATKATLIARVSDHLQQAKVLEFAVTGSHKEVDRYFGGPVSSRELEEVICAHFSRSLKGVAWKLDDATLDPRAGACATCPKNARNIDGKSADVCMDLSCLKHKADAQWERFRLENLGSEKIVVYSTKTSKDLFDGHGRLRAPLHLELDAVCYEDKKNRTYRELLKGSGMLVLVARTTEDKRMELVARDWAEQHLKKAGILKQTRQEEHEKGLEERRQTKLDTAEHDEAMILRHEVVRSGAMAKLMKKVADPKRWPRDIWEMIVHPLVTACDYDIHADDDGPDAFTRRGLKVLGFNDGVKRVPITDLITLAVELVCELGDGCGDGVVTPRGYDDNFERLCKLYKIDLKKLEREMKPNAPKQSGVGWEAKYAGKINSGFVGSIDWPGGANAVQCLYAGGKRANVMKANLITLKGAGSPTKVFFGKVPFAGTGKKRHPVWAKFEAVKS